MGMNDSILNGVVAGLKTAHKRALTIASECSMLALMVPVMAICSAGCEYEFKEDNGSSKVVLLEQIPRVSADSQGAASAGANKSPQSPDVRPTLAPGKLVSGEAAIPAHAKRINLSDLVERGLLTVKTNVPGLGDVSNAFDEVESSLAKSEGTNPFTFTFEFTSPINLKATKVLSTYSDYGWAVEAEGSPRIVVDTVIEGQWSTAAWPEGIKTKTVKVEVLRKARDNYVHLNEIELYE